MNLKSTASTDNDNKTTDNTQDQLDLEQKRNFRFGLEWTKFFCWNGKSSFLLVFNT